MRTRLLTTICVLAMLFGAVGSATAHTVQTATGHSVNHDHPTNCPLGSCPLSDTAFENTYGFSSQDRIYSANTEWNCHGRTFDGRNSWVFYADPYLNYDSPYCPAYPGYGDSIIWWNGSVTKHSVTIVGSWNSTSTRVMSKYGSQGQYRHALYNTVAVYGSNWAVTNFGAGTTIYSGLTSGEETTTKRSGKLTPEGPPVNLLEQRKLMPWYEDVLKSEAIYEVEHPRLVARVAQLTEEGKKEFLDATGDEERIKALVNDFKDSSHYGFLGVYNHPSFCEDFIAELEAGKLLVRLADKRPEVLPLIAESLTDLLLKEKVPFEDRVRGAALHFLSQILDDESRALVKKELSPAFDKKTEDGVSSFTAYYLSKM